MCEKLLFTMFFTIYKPKITVHEQWTVPNMHLGKKKCWKRAKKQNVAMDVNPNPH